MPMKVLGRIFGPVDVILDSNGDMFERFLGAAVLA
jgi:hypothetical protein